MSRRLLVIDDEQGIRDALSQLLEYEGYEVRAEASGAAGLAAYEQFRPQLTFLDVKMAGMDGLETLRKIRALDPAAIVVMISGHATIQNAVEATQGGAYDIMEKPLDTERILVTLRNAIGHLDLREENARLREVVEQKYQIVGRSYAIRALIETIERVAATDARVLISGENGTGKELVARALHLQSRRAAGPFVEVNCAAIPSELIESELFGHMKGSFTGATQDRAGKFEQADGGTLFLDEVGDMPLELQAKLLRVLQEKELTRVGGRDARALIVEKGRSRFATIEECPENLIAITGNLAVTAVGGLSGKLAVTFSRQYAVEFSWEQEHLNVEKMRLSLTRRLKELLNDDLLIDSLTWSATREAFTVAALCDIPNSLTTLGEKTFVAPSRVFPNLLPDDITEAGIQKAFYFPYVNRVAMNLTVTTAAAPLQMKLHYRNPKGTEFDFRYELE